MAEADPAAITRVTPRAHEVRGWETAREAALLEAALQVETLFKSYLHCKADVLAYVAQFYVQEARTSDLKNGPRVVGYCHVCELICSLGYDWSDRPPCCQHCERLVCSDCAEELEEDNAEEPERDRAAPPKKRKRRGAKMYEPIACCTSSTRNRRARADPSPEEIRELRRGVDELIAENPRAVLSYIWENYSKAYPRFGRLEPNSGYCDGCEGLVHETPDGRMGPHYERYFGMTTCFCGKRTWCRST